MQKGFADPSSICAFQIGTSGDYAKDHGLLKQTFRTSDAFDSAHFFRPILLIKHRAIKTY